jgi:dolichol kinase
MDQSTKDREKVAINLIHESTESESTESEKVDEHQSTATRNDLQIPRRLFHMTMGTVVATVYSVLLSHQQLVYFLGTIACSLYIFEQVRVAYPEYSAKFNVITKYFYRAEEQLKESAGIPYAIGLLLTILTFPKPVAIAAIFTLAFADPLSAIIGIRFGKRRIVKEKSLEGSAAFFIATFLVVMLTFFSSVEGMTWTIVGMSFLVALLGSAFEMIPLRIDDNLTIPLFTAIILWVLCGLLSIPTL